MAIGSSATGNLAGVSGEAPADRLDVNLDRLRSLIEEDRVEEARALAPQLVERWPEDARAQHWARVLEPPRVRRETGAPNQDFSAERAWLKEHRSEYPGCWIAVRGDQLVAANRELQQVYEAVRKTPGAEGAVIYFQGAERS